jgi:hypothetical protein
MNTWQWLIFLTWVAILITAIMIFFGGSWLWPLGFTILSLVASGIYGDKLKKGEEK